MSLTIVSSALMSFCYDKHDFDIGSDKACILEVQSAPLDLDDNVVDACDALDHVEVGTSHSMIAQHGSCIRSDASSLSACDPLIF